MFQFDLQIETPISKLKYTRDDVSRNQITMFEETKKDLKNEISPDQKSLSTYILFLLSQIENL